MSRSLFITVCTLFTIMVTTSCVVVKQDEIAVKRRVGKLVGTPFSEGTRFYNPFVSTYIKIPTRIVNERINLDIPSKEGLTISCEASILYRVNPDKIKDLLRLVGTNYEEDLITPVFRSAMADVSSQFMAKDMHTGERGVIEDEVQKLVMETVGEKGIIIERVLLKRIILPQTLTDAIEYKLAAEQDAQRMTFVLQREKLEADRKKIEAQGDADAQNILSEALTDQILELKMIEAYLALAESTNAKIVFGTSSMPMLLGNE